MKKIYTLLFFIALSSLAISQQRSAIGVQPNLLKEHRFPEILRTTCDSIGWPPPNNYSINWYTLNNNGGYVSGNNKYGDIAKANYWDASANAGTYLSKVIIGIGKCNGPTLSKAIDIKVYDGTAGTPGAVLGTINSTMRVMKDVAAGGGFFIFNFSPAITLPASKKVFVSIEFPSLVWDEGINPATKDTLAILSTLFNEPVVGLGWEKWSDNTWINMNSANAWGGNINMHVYPLVSDNAACTLPVAFGMLQGKFANSNVSLHWNTYAEIENVGFEIERSGDGQKFSSIGNVNTKAFNGNHNGQLNYQFNDLNPLNGQNIYRIKQTDRNGQYAHSNVINVFARNVSNQNIRSYYPNPTTGNLVVEFTKMMRGNATIQINDAAGKVVLNNKSSISTKSNIVVTTAGLKAGVYMLTLTEDNGSRSVIKFVMQ